MIIVRKHSMPHLAGALLLAGLAAATLPAGAQTYVDCGSGCTNLASGKPVTASGLWNPTNNPATKLNDANLGTPVTCEGATGTCAIASDSIGAQAIGNYFQIDLGAIASVKSVTIYGRRDTALAQGRNLNLKTSTDGTTWTTVFVPDTTSASGATVNTARVARFVRVETTTVNYLSLYEVVVAGDYYVDCGGSCSNLQPGKSVSASGLWNATTNPATKVNDSNTGTTSTCEGASGYCAIASDATGGQAIGNYLQVDLGAVMSVKTVTVYGRRDTAQNQGRNLNLELSTDGTNWSTTFIADAATAAGATVSPARAARYVRVETTTLNYLSLYEVVISGFNNGSVSGYVDCGSNCVNLAGNKPVSYSGLWNATLNPAYRVNDGNTAPINPACQGSSGACAIASTSSGAQGIGVYLQIDLGQIRSVRDVVVYGRRDTALAQARNLNLKLSANGSNWTTFFIADTTSTYGYTVNTAMLARYVRVETTTNNYLSLYEVLARGLGTQLASNPCVPDVVGAFDALTTAGERTAIRDFRLSQDQPLFDANRSNFRLQGIAYHGGGQYLVLSGTGGDGSEISSTVLPALDTPGLRGLGRPHLGLSLPSTDLRPAQLAGRFVGLTMFGDYVVAPRDGSADGTLAFYDIQDPRHPSRLSFSLPRAGKAPANAASVLRLRNSGQYLLAVQSAGGTTDLDFYLSQGTSLHEDPAFAQIPGSASTSFAAQYQSLNLVEQCANTEFPAGRLFLIGISSADGASRSQADTVDLFEVTFPGGFSLPPMLTSVGWMSADGCSDDGADWCRFRTTVGSFVTPSGGLKLYSSYIWDDDNGDATLRVVEY